MTGKATVLDEWFFEKPKTIVNLTIGDQVIPCEITENPDFDTDSDEPIELKWRLSCKVDDAGYRVLYQAYCSTTYCSLESAGRKGIIDDLQFFVEARDAALIADFFFSELAMGGIVKENGVG